MITIIKGFLESYIYPFSLSKSYIIIKGENMAATPKGPQKIKLDYYLDRDIYNVFIKACGSRGYAPQVIIERLMKKFSETGQI